MALEFTPKQQELLKACSTAKHVMAYGGSRSGKTFGLVYAVCTRAVKCAGSRHLIARFRFNHVKQSVLNDTFPKVMELAYPNFKYKIDKMDWVVRFPNGSEVWFGGLDEKERTEKILGQEYATIYLNECSQIGIKAVNIAKTRLAQNTELVNRMFYDCNPPSLRHWTYQHFIEGLEKNAAYVQMNPADNMANLPADYLDVLEALPEAEKQRFLYGEFSDSVDGSYYGTFIREARNQKRITAVPYDPMLEVNTAWDLGQHDPTAIWFFQVHGGSIRMIDYHEESYMSAADAAELLKRKGYRYGKHWPPHDAKVTETSGQTRLDTYRKAGVNFEEPIKILRIEDGIQKVKNILPKCYFDEDKCKDGIDSLIDYREDIDEKTGLSKNKPIHDWSSHGADAMRYLATVMEDNLYQRGKFARPIKYNAGKVW